MTLTEMQIEARQAVDKTFRNLGCPELIEKTSVVWNNRYTSRAGTATYVKNGKSLIELSNKLFRQATPEQRYQTAVHEACHIVADHVVSRREGHGSYWKFLMRRMGLQSKRCHDIDVTVGRRQRYATICDCGSKLDFGPTVHQRLLKGCKYRCCKCKRLVDKDSVKRIN